MKNMDFNPLRKYMRELIEKGVPGCEMAVALDHKILFHECAGHSDYEGKRPASTEDQYWMYSCTKPVTAAAAMSCVEKGLFALEDPVAEYLPAYEKCFVMEDGKRRAVGRRMTIRHLLTMTAGLTYNLNRESVRRALEKEGEGSVTRRVAEALAEDPLSFEPGKGYEYSLCHDVVGAVIEVASGMAFGRYVKENILSPLGMGRTRFWPSGGELPENLAAQYRFHAREGRATPVDPENVLRISPEWESGGAGLVSCVEDYLKFADALACGGVGANGAAILTRESVERMREEQLSALGVADCFGCTCGPDYGYGLGVRTRVAFNEGGVSAMGEFGWDGAAGVDVGVDVENRLSFVYAQQVLEWPAMLGAVHLRIRDIIYPILRGAGAVG